MLKGCESGRWIGIPDKVLEATGEPAPQTPSQFFIHFLATSVEQPATLKIKQP